MSEKLTKTITDVLVKTFRNYPITKTEPAITGCQRPEVRLSVPLLAILTYEQPVVSTKNM